MIYKNTRSHPSIYLNTRSKSKFNFTIPKCKRKFNVNCQKEYICKKSITSTIFNSIFISLYVITLSYYIIQLLILVKN